ncbi:MAG: hypothetical protein ACI4GC_01225 [Acutalibacteraceae bacterium]
MDKQLGIFRTVAFGGFNKKDVIDYIEKIRNDYYKYKSEVDETVKALSEKISEFENAAKLSQQDEPSQEVAVDVQDNVKADDIDSSAKHLKSVADELCKSLSDFMDKLIEREHYCQVNLSEEAQIENAEQEALSFEDREAADVELSVFDKLFPKGASFIFDASEKTAAVEEKPQNEKKKNESDSVLSVLDSVSFLK